VDMIPARPMARRSNRLRALLIALVVCSGLECASAPHSPKGSCEAAREKCHNDCQGQSVQPSNNYLNFQQCAEACDREYDKCSLES